MLAFQSCLLTDIVDQLHEDSKKINIVDRLSRHLDKGTPAKAAVSYLQMLKKWIPATELRDRRKGKIKKRRRQTLVPDETSGLPSTLP